jgi:hypothetical protein
MSSMYSLSTTDWLTGVKDGHFELRNGNCKIKITYCQLKIHNEISISSPKIPGEREKPENGEQEKKETWKGEWRKKGSKVVRSVWRRFSSSRLGTLSDDFLPFVFGHEIVSRFDPV